MTDSLRVIRHDLRNRLTGVRQAAHYLSRKVQKVELWETDPRVPRFFALIDEELDSADRSIGERLWQLFARGRAVVDASECARSVLDGWEGHPDVRVEPPRFEPALVDADAFEVMLMVQCLLERAVEALPHGGSIRVEVRADALADGRVSIGVTGIGPGGLELEIQPMVRRTARRHGGDVAIRPEGAGNTVQITLPGARHA